MRVSLPDSITSRKQCIKTATTMSRGKCRKGEGEGKARGRPGEDWVKER
jgi:hypothetical protein